MKQLTHKEVSSRGGKNSWKGKSKKERTEILKQRWLIRKLNKQVRKAIKEDWIKNPYKG